MGISNFHTWVDARFDAAQAVDPKAVIATDHLLIDLNSLVHGAARKAKNDREAVKRCVQKLDGLLHPARPGATFRPRLSVGLFSDGPAPLAKLVTQRKRRLAGRCAARADGCDDAPPGGFDSLAISPGTAFQRDLAAALKAWARKRAASAAGFPRRVVVSDSDVVGEGELKAMEYVDALGPDADVVVYGGDADLVAMALCRPPLRGRLTVVDEGGRAVDAARLAARLSRDGGDDAPLDFVVLAIAAGGNDYLPPLAVSADALWRARSTRQQPLFADGRVDRRALGAAVAAAAAGGGAGGKGRGRGRGGRGRGGGTAAQREEALVEDHLLDVRGDDGSPAAPRSVQASLADVADGVVVRVFPPRDFGDVASGAEALRYRVAVKDGARWVVAEAYADGAPLADVPLAALSAKAGVLVRAAAGAGDVAVRADCRRDTPDAPWGRGRIAKVRRDKAYLLEMCPKGAACPKKRDCPHAHVPAELARHMADDGDGCPVVVEDVAAGPRRAAPGTLDAACAWDAHEWLATLEWVVSMYRRGRCVDFRLRYAGLAAPPPEVLVAACADGDAAVSEPARRPSLAPHACLAALLPGRSAARLLPEPLRTMLDDGSPVAREWWGCPPVVDVDAIEAEIARRRCSAPPQRVALFDRGGEERVLAMADGAVLYPAEPARGKAGGATVGGRAAGAFQPERRLDARARTFRPAAADRPPPAPSAGRGKGKGKGGKGRGRGRGGRGRGARGASPPRPPG